MKIHWLRLCVVGMLLVPYVLAMAQEISSIDLVAGNYSNYATTLKLADLPDDYKPVRLATATTEPLLDLVPLLPLAMSSDNGKTLARYRLAQCYWSNGDVVKSMGRDYLVAYKVDWNFESLLQDRSSNSLNVGAVIVTNEPKLKINLIAVSSIQKVEPCPDVTKKDLLDAFGGGAVFKPSVASAQTTTLSNVKQIALGLIMYTTDYDDSLPYAQSSKAAWFVEYPYVKNADVFKTLNPNGGAIRFNMGVSGVLMTSIAEPAQTVMLYESEPWPDGRRVVAFIDGHAKLIPEDEWKELARRLKPAGIKRAKKPLPASYEAEFDKVMAQWASRQRG